MKIAASKIQNCVDAGKPRCNPNEGGRARGIPAKFKVYMRMQVRCVLHVTFVAISAASSWQAVF